MATFLHFHLTIFSLFNVEKKPGMAKIKSGIQRFSGKLGDEVYVDSHRYPPHVRKPVKPGSKGK